MDTWALASEPSSANPNLLLWPVVRSLTTSELRTVLCADGSAYKSELLTSWPRFPTYYFLPIAD